jgi:uncharacterized membrane protein
MEYYNYFLLYLLIAIGGLLLEVAFKKIYYQLTDNHYKIHHFSAGKYIFFLTLPLLATALLGVWYGRSIIVVFMTFALVGTFLEWLIGWSYYQIVGEQLWSYHRYSIGPYTSLLSMPLWGVGGGLFWLLAHIFV